nr:glycosyltransferase [Leucobacter luti]
MFIYAGTYTGLHGAEILIDAFASFAETHPGYRLRFIGNGTGQEEMRARAAALGIADAVEFAEPVPAAELSPQLSRAVASLATLKPGGGYEYAFTSKAYSSLAAGCPVIFAGPGPTGPFMAEAATHVPVGTAVDYDVAAIAAALRDAADAPLSAGDRQRVAEWTAAHHSMRAVAERVAARILAVGTAGKRRRARDAGAGAA